MRLSSGQGLYPAVILCSGVLTLVLFASLFQREAVVDISSRVAQKASDGFYGVKNKLSHEANTGYLSTQANMNNPAYLEPEWEFARDLSVVYTWVNGSEPSQRALRQQFGAPLDGERDRDNDDFRHSLRAFNKYWPWHRGTIYIVTPGGHYANWLDLNNPRIKIINQDDMLPVEDRPSFNSNCLEAFFHNIPGITSKFIILNDDYFFGRIIHPSDLFTKPNIVTGEYGVKMFLEPWNMGNASIKGGIVGDQWYHSVKYTAKVVLEAYEELFVEHTRVTEHAPFVFDTRAFEGIHHRFNHVLRKNCRHKMRHVEDAIVPFLLDQYVIQEGSRCCGIKYEIVENQAKFFEWQIDTERNLKEWNALIESKPTFFNINDKMGYDKSKLHLIKKAQEQLKDIMEKYLPDPSEFERLD